MTLFYLNSVRLRMKQLASPGSRTNGNLGFPPTIDAVRERLPPMTNFLDRLPVAWSTPEPPELRDLLVVGFRRVEALESLAEEAGIVPGTFPFAYDVRSTCHKLIETMASQGKLRTLVENAAQSPLAGAFKDRFREMLGAEPALTTVGAYIEEPHRDDSRLVARNLERLMEKRSRLMSVELARQITGFAPAVARLVLNSRDRRGYGTGFLITADLLLTSHHNLMLEAGTEQQAPVITAVAEFDWDMSPPEKPLVRGVNIAPVAADAAADWAVLRLASPVDRTPFTLGSRSGPCIDDLLVIIQHPLGARKQFALEPLAVWEVDERYVRYLADTLRGSSGSPVCNERMEVVAIHKGESGRVVPSADGPQTIWRNMGVRIEAAAAALDELGISYRSGMMTP
ncbi:trypsin-like serine peptidase [Nocardia bovistercoris]|uniref:Serine protease n=1 Tax=Nocardia bovistercoris TaxID=2785916 RepID=A0A931I747_9NOCA|nr:serine protease [Nocardia bovistercoris]MBH0775007.1 trypsin-like peptidase domain-containing protein [Nocardia bovistercoris]